MPSLPPVRQFSLTPKPQDSGLPQQNPQIQSASPLPPVKQFELPKSAQPSPTVQGAFSTPLTNIASGNSEANIQHSIGAGKGILKQIRDVAGVDTNPVVKDMVSHAPAMQSALDAENQAIAPSNLEQAKGRSETALGAGLIPVGQTAKAASATKGLLGKVLTGEKDAVLEAVSPRLTPKIAAETPTKTVGLMKKIVPVADKKLKNVADTVRSFFNPKATFSENAQVTGNELKKEADLLENTIDEVNHPIVIKELGSRLTNAEEPLSLKGTSFEKQIAPLKKAAVDLTKKHGGTVKGAFKALREFDDYVEKTWPNLWDRENAPMRNAITALRNEWKTFIEENLPKDSIYRDSLKKQTNLFEARDVFREKAALGELNKQGEIGTNSAQRFAGKHPYVTKGAIGAAGLLGLGELKQNVPWLPIP